MNTTLENPPSSSELRFIPEAGAVRPYVTLADVKCKQCSGNRFDRVPRLGFWQETVMPFFGLYPWRCIACATVMYRSDRSAPPRRR
jgi:hypothetical protein